MTETTQEVAKPDETEETPGLRLTGMGGSGFIFGFSAFWGFLVAALLSFALFFGGCAEVLKTLEGRRDRLDDRVPNASPHPYLDMQPK